MANIRERAGSVHVRVGGNTQDYATLVDSTSHCSALEKYYNISSNPVILYPSLKSLVRCLITVTLVD